MAHTSAKGLPMAAGIELVPTKQLPDRFRPMFPFPFFNAMQSKCFTPAYHDYINNFVLSAPTGSGKTAILELAICGLIVHSSATDVPHFKVVYLAPTKALCSERQRDWSRKFVSAGLKVQELTGDTELSELRRVQTADIIITTPEKWDSVTRKWQDHAKLIELVKLLLIDEVHILKDDRGATLETVVSRMKTLGRSMRFIALSATVPNSEDVAHWLGKNHETPHRQALRHVFGEQFRPVPLKKYVLGIPSNAQSDWQFETVCSSRLADVISQHSARKPIMVFCFTRKSTLQTAEALADWWQKCDPSERCWDAPTRVPFVPDPALHEFLKAGVAFHNAGLDSKTRSNIENAYLSGLISVLCCTSTLAIGINLPCHLVIIKNTITYQMDTGACKEYSDLDIMQMLGRAGRPQFDDNAIAIIMTRPEKVARYERMASGQEPLESKLHLNLIEHLNAEICLGTISSVKTACDWLESTFLAVRMSKNPQHYKIEGDMPSATLKQRAKQICSRDIDKLLRYHLAAGAEKFGATEYGRAMARYHIQFETMRLVVGLQEKAKVSELLSAIAQSSELRCLRFKAGEKPLYKEINASPMLRYPIKVNLDLPAHKASLVIQAALGGLDVAHNTRYSNQQRQYHLDTSLAMQHAKRLLRCIIDCKIEAKDSTTVRHALELARSVGAQAWDDSAQQLSQLEGIGPVAVRKLVSHDVKTLEDLELAGPQRIDMALSKNPPFGINLLQQLTAFPKLRLSLKIDGTPHRHNFQSLRIRVGADIGFLNDKVPSVWMRSTIYVHFLAETSDGKLVHFERATARSLSFGNGLEFDADIQPGQTLTGYVACDELAGTLQQATINPNFSPKMDAIDEFGGESLADEDFFPVILSIDDIMSDQEPGEGDLDDMMVPENHVDDELACDHEYNDSSTVAVSGARRTDDEQDAVAWVLQEFGDYIEVV